MSNMSQEEHFTDFAVVMVVVCLPFFLLIGSLNTTAGMTFWRNKWHNLLDWFKRLGPARQPKPEPPVKSSEAESGVKMRRSYSTARAIDIRKNQLKGPTSPKAGVSENMNGRTSSSRFEFHTKNIRPGVSPVAATSGDTGSSVRNPLVVDDRPPKPETIRPPLTWREAVFGRKTTPVWGHNV